MRLAGLTLGTAAGREQYERIFARHLDRNISSYFFEQVLSGQPPELELFLLQSSVMERFNVDSLAALTDTDRAVAHDMLREIALRGFFVVPLDSFGDWYRYHSQFRAMLQSRLALRQSAEQINQLHRRAASWLQANDLIDDALRHYLIVEDFDAAAALVEREIPRTMNEERFEQLRGWIEALPVDVVNARPRLLLARAWYEIFHFRYVQVPTLLTQAEKALAAAAPDQAETRALQGQILALRSAPAMGLPHEEAIADFEAALRAMPDEPGWERAMTRNFYAQRLVLAGRHDQAMAMLADALMKAPTRYCTYSARLVYAMGVISYSGSLHVFRQVVLDLLDIGRELNLPALIAVSDFGLAVYDWENNGHEAIARFETVLQRNQAAQFGAMLVAANYLLPEYARCARTADGEKVLNMLRRRFETLYDAHLHKELEAIQAIWDMELGRTAAAAAWAARSEDDQPTTMLSFCGWRLADVLIRLGRPDTLQRALRVLAGLHEKY